MRSIAIALSLTACASSPALFCSTPTDMSGRGIPLCRASTQEPVCDAPGMHASYVMDPVTGGYTLMGGVLAVCDTSNEIVCPDRTESPHCVDHPISPGP